jgi:hypothetical protein
MDLTTLGLVVCTIPIGASPATPSRVRLHALKVEELVADAGALFPAHPAPSGAAIGRRGHRLRFAPTSRVKGLPRARVQRTRASIFCLTRAGRADRWHSLSHPAV